tara:strand:+ start:1048 stop:1569 length:522 start_codon:yes stop_codon:yes gene_type:complete
MPSMINFNDPQIWVAFSFILFFLLFGKFIWKKFSSFLDGKINIIKNEINNAHKLHNEAKDLLSEEMKRFQGLENQIKEIIEEGKVNANDLYVENKKRISIEIEKLEKASLEKINYLEQQVILELQKKVTEKAIQISHSFLINNLNKDSHNESINNSIKEIELSLDSKHNKFIQ